MGIPVPLDAAIAAPAAILGLLGVWLGFVRSSVAWPMRWLVPLLGAYAAGRLAEIGLLILWEVADLSQWVGPPVSWVAFIVAFLAALVPLLMFMDNLMDRVAVWTAQRRIGLGERALGGLFGIACGLILAAVVVEHTPMRRAMADEPAWLRASVVLPYFRSVSEAVEGALSQVPRLAAGTWRRER
jgi:uncharacterized membrane protein required for colicin V production